MTSQAEVGTWHQTTFGDIPLEWLGLKLAEETGEVGRVLLGMAGEPIREGRVHAQLADEIADVLIVLMALADRAGIDIDGALQVRFLEVSQRQYGPDPQQEALAL